ncbi:uncharacterized protein MAM_08035 [Metarhizium album ARSEF 1941]|uniref:Concanavalin A-like lectin/glucanase n=1 Tax=Metarhizium album (strain ARSEF 1941) TaxID=1081103 RepID=A0A0B2WM61_METAS|nr:uncharacterized protein MAM_08035 [Metarhizium album ARSEF 1941]KHN94105.1 hypothetical protein MAM_08035 [Metarhizium album ARSEF 1941]
MKVQTRHVLALTVLPGCQAMSSFPWRFGNAPAKGATDITFPIKVVEADHNVQWYFAQQFRFLNKGMGYCGLQPQDDAKGKSRIRGVFSSFTGGTTSNDTNCGDGADGGPGVSCGVIFDHDYSHKVNMVVENGGGDKWIGKAVDATTGQETHIGSWTLPSGSGNINLGGDSGFVERFLHNDQPCSQIPRIVVNFYDPTSKTCGAGNSSIGTPKEYDFCKGQKNWTETQFAGGRTIGMGFKQAAVVEEQTSGSGHAQDKDSSC